MTIMMILHSTLIRCFRMRVGPKSTQSCMTLLFLQFFTLEYHKNVYHPYHIQYYQRTILNFMMTQVFSQLSIIIFQNICCAPPLPIFLYTYEMMRAVDYEIPFCFFDRAISQETLIV